jgi:hypothetical protein
VLCSAFIFSTIKCTNETVCAWLVVPVSRAQWAGRECGGGACGLPVMV